MFEPEKRSEVMSRIRSKGSKAEQIVFSYLRKEGVYSQKHYKRAPGKPDIAMPRKKLAVFIDGDFWHGRDYERVVNVTKSEYWTKKIKSNMDRDAKNFNLLTEKNWRVLRVWESDINRKRTKYEVLEKIKNFLTT